MAKLVLTRGGKILMRPVNSVATTEALAAMDAAVAEVHVISGLTGEDAAMAAIADDDESDFAGVLTATIGDQALEKVENLGDLPDAVEARDNLQVPYRSFLARNAADAGLGSAASPTDQTAAINSWLQDMKAAQRVAFLPRLEYMATQIVIPYGARVEGAGIGGFGGVTADTGGDAAGDLGTRLIQNPSAGSTDFVVFELGGTGDVQVGPLHLSHMCIVGQGAGVGKPYSHGIAVKGTDGTIGRIQDTTILANLLVTRFTRCGFMAGGGGARPFHMRDCNFLWNGDVGVHFESIGYLTQMVHFDNISGDGNNNGLFRVKALDRMASVLFTAIKSERRLNNYDSNADAQADSIIFEDCDDTAVTIDGLTHISSVPQSATFKPPGAAIVVKGTGKPQIVYRGVTVRVRPSDQAGSPATLRDDALTLGDGTTKYSLPVTATTGVREGIYGGTDGSYSWSQSARQGEVDPLVIGESSMSRNTVVAAQTLTSQQLRVSFFTAKKTEAITHVRLIPGGTSAGATPTLVRVGIYEVADDGSATLIKSSTNDTSKLNAQTDAAHTFTLSSTFTKIRGKRYGVGVLCVTAAAAPTLQGGNFAAGSGVGLPALMLSKGGQSDLPSSLTTGDLSSSTSTVRIYSELVP